MLIQGLESNSCYTFEIPDPPAKKLIAGHDNHIADQYWVRPYQFTDDEFYHLSNERQTEIIEQEFLRCNYDGYWFKNYGEDIYINPDNYFYLTHWTNEGKYFRFIKNQTLDFHFYKFCEDDPYCFGSCELKPRQEGSTAKKQAIYVNRAINTPQKHLGIQSKTGDDASKVNFLGIMNGFQGLPHFMKPRVKAEGVAGELNFSQASKRYTSRKGKTDFDSEESEDKARYLNTRIDWKTTTVKAYDGKHLFRYIGDEFFKWESANAYDTWFTVKRALGDEFEMWGKAFLLSTIGTDDEKEKVSQEAIDNGIKIWNESSTAERDNLGYTKTGLYRWFIPTYRSKRGSVLDKYGNVDEKYVKRVLMEKRNNEKDPRRKIILIRQDPMNPQEALSTMSTTSTFANIQERLTEHYNMLVDYVPTPERPVKYRRGNLHWINNERFGRVRFIDDPNGRFLIAFFPDIAGGDKTNHFKEIGINQYAPFGYTQFVIGLDPVDFKNVQYGEGSNPAFYVKLRYNYANPEMSNIYCCEYMERPDLATFHEDVFKTMFFYGAKLHIERQLQVLFQEVKQVGCKAFLMTRPDSSKWNRKTDKDNDYGTPRSPQTMQIGCELIENQFTPPNAEQNENVTDNLKNFWFERGIKQLMDFDPNNAIKFDLVSAMIQTELGSQGIKKYLPKQQMKVNPNAKSPIDYLFPAMVNGQTVTHASIKEQRTIQIQSDDPTRRPTRKII